MAEDFIDFVRAERLPLTAQQFRDLRAVHLEQRLRDHRSVHPRDAEDE